MKNAMMHGYGAVRFEYASCVQVLWDLAIASGRFRNAYYEREEL